MKIRMKTLLAGPEGVLAAGQVADLPEAQAQALIAGGYAMSADIPLPPTPVEASAPAESEPAILPVESSVEPKKPARRRRG